MPFTIAGRDFIGLVMGTAEGLHGRMKVRGLIPLEPEHLMATNHKLWDAGKEAYGPEVMGALLKEAQAREHEMADDQR